MKRTLLAVLVAFASVAHVFGVIAVTDARKLPKVVFRHNGRYFNEMERFADLTNFLALAEQALREGDARRAFEYAQQGDRRYVGYPKTYAALGDARYLEGAYYDALAHYNKALRYSTVEPEAYFGLAKTYTALREYENAYRCYMLGFRMTGDGDFVYRAGMLALELNDYASANYYFVYLRKRARYQTAGYTGLGLLNEAQSNFAGAYTNYMRAYDIVFVEFNEEQFDMNVETLPPLFYVMSNRVHQIASAMYRAQYSMNMQTLQKSVAAGLVKGIGPLLQETIQLDSNRGEAFRLLADVRYMQEDYVSAKTYYTMALARNTNDALAYTGLSRTAYAEGDTAGAIERLVEAMRITQTDKTIYTALADALLEANAPYFADAVSANNILRFEALPEDLYRAARILTRKGEYREAYETLTRYVQMGGMAHNEMKELESFLKARMNFDAARAFILSGEPLRVVEGFKDVRLSGENEELRLHILAEAYRKANETEKAYRALLEAYASGTLSRMNKATLETLTKGLREYYRLKDAKEYEARSDEFEQTLSALAKERALFIETPETLRAHMRLLIAARDFDAAYAAMQRARASRSDGKTAFKKECAWMELQYGIRLYLDARPGEAKFYFERAYKDDPLLFDAAYFIGELTSDETLSRIAAFERVGDDARAAALYPSLFERIPYRHFYRGDAIRAHIRSGNLGEALSQAKAFTRIYPRSGGSYEALGDVQFARKRYVDAIVAYNTGASYDKDSTVYNRKSAKALLEMGRAAEAERVLLAVVEAYPSPEAQFDYAQALYDRKKFAAARAAMETAANEEPENWRYLLNLGIILFDMGENGEALKTFSNAYRLSPNNEDAIFYYARSLFYAKNYEEALRLTRTLLQSAPRNPLYRYALSAIYEARAKERLSDRISANLNRAIHEMESCVRFCRAGVDDELLRDAQRKLKELKQRIHALFVTALPAPLAQPPLAVPGSALAYLALENNLLVAADLVTGEIFWTLRLNGKVSSKLQFALGNVCFGVETGEFYIVDANTGTTVYSFIAPGAILGEPLPFVERHGATRAVNRIVVTSDSGRVYLLDYDERKKSVKESFVQFPRAIATSATYASGTLFFASEGGVMYAMEIATGRTLWTLETGGAIWHTLLLVDNDLYAASDSGTLYRVDSRTGQTLSRYTFRSAGVKTLQYSNGYLFFGDADGRFYVCKRDLRNAGYDTFGAPVTGGVAFMGEYLLFSAENGSAYLKSLREGATIERIAFNARATHAPITLSETTAAFVTDTGEAYIVALRDPAAPMAGTIIP